MTITAGDQTTTTFIPDFDELGFRVDEEGVSTVVSSLRHEGPQLAARARCVGLALASVEVLTDTDASDTLWLRAYVTVRVALADTRADALTSLDLTA